MRPSSASQLLDMLARRDVLSGLEALPDMVVFVTADACDLIESAAASLPADTQLDVTMLPGSPDALYFFARSMTPPELTGRTTTATDALLTGEDSTHMALCSMPTYWLDDNLHTVDVDVWWWGTHLVEFPEASESQDVLTDRTWTRRLVAATLLLAGQPITETSEAQLDRAARRRLQRNVRRLPDVRVLGLRRRFASDPSAGGESRSRPSHRFVVRGHWRSQPWGPRSSLRRQTWIAPHVKGPEDAPLDVRPAVWKLIGRTENEL